MRLVALFFSLVMLGSVAAAEKGQVIGAASYSMPDWFKPLFGDIQIDAEEADDVGKHLILFMHLKNCPYCAKMLDENFRDGPTKDRIERDFDVVGINIEGNIEVAFNEDMVLEERELADRLNVRSTPSILFINGANELVLRVDGYRSNGAFEKVLDFVSGRHYESQSFDDYLAARNDAPDWEFPSRPEFTDSADLAAFSEGPMAILFESPTCAVDCQATYDTLLEDPTIAPLTGLMPIVRLNMMSEESIKGFDGADTTPKALAKSLGAVHAPSWALMIDGEVHRVIGSRLVAFHFGGSFGYLAERGYEKFESRADYRNHRQAQLIDAGFDIDYRIK
ncbi:MAG: thioredoxin fold domain-containing protein [Gammaproteobacteria bacterium]|nr:thioredoxin fold domain-containing protein [Gammaproteobacteria bacterium]